MHQWSQNLFGFLREKNLGKKEKKGGEGRLSFLFYFSGVTSETRSSSGAEDSKPTTQNKRRRSIRKQRRVVALCDY